MEPSLTALSTKAVYCSRGCFSMRLPSRQRSPFKPCLSSAGSRHTPRGGGRGTEIDKLRKPQKARKWKCEGVWLCLRLASALALPLLPPWSCSTVGQRQSRGEAGFMEQLRGSRTFGVSPQELGGRDHALAWGSEPLHCTPRVVSATGSTVSDEDGVWGAACGVPSQASHPLISPSFDCH